MQGKVPSLKPFWGTGKPMKELVFKIHREGTGCKMTLMTREPEKDMQKKLRQLRKQFNKRDGWIVEYKGIIGETYIPEED